MKALSDSDSQLDHSPPIHDCGLAFTLSLPFPLQMEGKEIARAIVFTVPFPQPNRPLSHTHNLEGHELCVLM